MKTILIVASVAASRDLLVSWLQDDYTVVTAADGDAGVVLAEQLEPDLIFMALALPEVESGEMSRRIKAQGRLRDIPMIALTARAEPGDGAMARVAGCVGMLHTPLDEELVYGVLRHWLGGG